MNALFYGNDTESLIAKEESLKKLGYIFFKGDKDNLHTQYHSQNLFEEKKNLIVESGSVLPSEIIEVIKDKGVIDIAYFNFDLTLKPTFIKLFEKSTALKLADDKAIFKFLDSLFSPNIKECLSYLKKFEKDSDKIYLISMIFFNLKNLCLFYLDKPAFYKLNPYVSRKSEELARKISYNSLKRILNIIAEADYKIKTSSDKDSVLISTILFISTIK